MCLCGVVGQCLGIFLRITRQNFVPPHSASAGLWWDIPCSEMAESERNHSSLRPAPKLPKQRQEGAEGFEPMLGKAWPGRGGLPEVVFSFRSALPLRTCIRWRCNSFRIKTKRSKCFECCEVLVLNITIQWSQRGILPKLIGFFFSDYLKWLPGLERSRLVRALKYADLSSNPQNAVCGHAPVTTALWGSTETGGHWGLLLSAQVQVQWENLFWGIRTEQDPLRCTYTTPLPHTYT